MNTQTTQQRLEHMLISRGMSEKQASLVMELAIPEINRMSAEIDGHKAPVCPVNIGGTIPIVANSVVTTYHITWDGPAYQYPDVLYGIWFLMIKPVALRWINENKPEARFKPMFE